MTSTRPVIRPAAEADAEQLIAFVQRLAEEPTNNILYTPGEFQRTVAEEQAFLRRMAHSRTSVFLVAAVDQRIVGVTDLHGEKKLAMRHCASMGISFAKDWRGKGIGTTLLEALITWAQKTGILRRIELQVFARNTGAIRLYERLGFVVEGRRKNSVFKDGEFIDDLIMAKWLCHRKPE
ncbi:MAG: GNAT family N-acetyltransferase [Cyanobacteria bacterium REEB65]|nr:GNAT family N-acetyltransferase [Cyanobacteria bacterium REEB65]